MNFTEHLNPKKTLELYNLKEEFAYFKNLINSRDYPRLSCSLVTGAVVNLL